MTEPIRYVWELLARGGEIECYPDSPRPELVGLTSGNPQRALDVGCHKGAVGAALKERFPGLECVGVELNEKAVTVARQRLDCVLTFDLMSEEAASHPAITPGFDLIVLADVLEHLYDPWMMLNVVRGWLRPGGRVYVSLPNVRNFKLLSDLIKGSWRYESAGLLDVTHIRFFSLSDAVRMFSETGFRVLNTASVRDMRIPLDRNQNTSVTISTPEFTLSNIDPKTLIELTTIQFLFVLEIADTN